MEQIKIAIPNKGRLKNKSIDILTKTNSYKIFENTDKNLSFESSNNKIIVFLVRAQDIPFLIASETVDLGITGFDIVKEFSFLNIQQLGFLNFGHCRMVVAADEFGKINSIDDLQDEMSVCTSFANITENFIKTTGLNLKIVKLSGAIESAIKLGLADFIIDITSSGKTLKANNLKIVNELFKSEAVLISRKNLNKDKKTRVFDIRDKILNTLKS